MAEHEVNAFSDVDHSDPHIKDYLHVLMRWRWLLFTVVFLSVACTTVTVFAMRPVYRPVCRLLLQPTRVNVAQFQEVYDPTFGAGGSAIMRRQFLETQYRLILSRPLLKKTFDDMGYSERPEFADVEDPIEGFGKRFSVNGIRNTLLVEVSFEWPDEPEVATRTLETLVTHYIQACNKRAMGVTDKGLIDLKTKAEELRPKLQAKAEELQAFIGEHNTISLDNNLNTVSVRLQELGQELTATEIKRIKAESRYNNILAALAAERKPEEMPEIVESATVRDLKLEYIRMRLTCSDLEDSLGPNHPQVKAARSTLDTLAQKLEMEVRSVLSAAQAEYLRAKEEEEALRVAFAKQKQEAMELNKLQAKYQPLKDGYDQLNSDYRNVAKRIGEIEISKETGAKDAGVYLDTPAEVPTRPAKPRKKVAVALSGMLGLLLGIGLCFLIDYFDTSVKSKDDVEALTHAPVIGLVPAVSNGQHLDGGNSGPIELLAATQPRSMIAEAFRSIRTALAFTRTNSQCHQFIVTSALPSEGKTLVSVNVALALAKTGKKVVLIDADLRRPRVHKVFGIGHDKGLSNLLAGDEDYDVADVSVLTNFDNLIVISSGPVPPNPAELLGGARMGELLARLAGEFDYVIFDTPPTVNVTDAAVLAQRVSGALLVVRTFETDKNAVSRARDLLGSANARLLGVVLNGVDAPRGSYKYDRYYNYGYGYHYGHPDDESRTTKPRGDEDSTETS